MKKFDETYAKIFKNTVVFVNSTKDRQKKLEDLLAKLSVDEFKAAICWNDPASDYNSTALHALITNESYKELSEFLDLARKYNRVIDFSVKDKEDKTIALTAIKMAVVDINIIELMLTEKTLNNSDSGGVTPLMLACALGRDDLVELILKKAKEFIEANKLDIKYMDILNMQDKQGRTAAHYAVMREGSNKDTGQNTVAGILKSIYVDKERDVSATRNAFRSDPQNPIRAWKPARLTSSFFMSKELPDSALLFCHENLNSLDTYTSLPYVKEQIGLLKNKSLAQKIMERKLIIFELLKSDGADLSIIDKNGQTPQEILISLKASNDLTLLDRQYLLQEKTSVQKQFTPKFSAQKAPDSPVASKAKEKLREAVKKIVPNKDWKVSANKFWLQLSNEEEARKIISHFKQSGCVTIKLEHRRDAPNIPIIILENADYDQLIKIPPMQASFQKKEDSQERSQNFKSNINNA